MSIPLKDCHCVFLQSSDLKGNTEKDQRADFISATNSAENVMGNRFSRKKSNDENASREGVVLVKVDKYSSSSTTGCWKKGKRVADQSNRGSGQAYEPTREGSKRSHSKSDKCGGSRNSSPGPKKTSDVRFNQHGGEAGRKVHQGDASTVTVQIEPPKSEYDNSNNWVSEHFKPDDLTIEQIRSKKKGVKTENATSAYDYFENLKKDVNSYDSARKKTASSIGSSLGNCNTSHQSRLHGLENRGESPRPIGSCSSAYLPGSEKGIKNGADISSGAHQPSLPGVENRGRSRRRSGSYSSTYLPGSENDRKSEADRTSDAKDPKSCGSNRTKQTHKQKKDFVKPSSPSYDSYSYDVLPRSLGLFKGYMEARYEPDDFKVDYTPLERSRGVFREYLEPAETSDQTNAEFSEKSVVEQDTSSTPEYWCTIAVPRVLRTSISESSIRQNAGHHPSSTKKGTGSPKMPDISRTKNSVSDSSQLSRSVPNVGRPQDLKGNPECLADTRPDYHRPKKVPSADSVGATSTGSKTSSKKPTLSDLYGPGRVTPGSARRIQQDEVLDQHSVTKTKARGTTEQSKSSQPQRYYLRSNSLNETSNLKTDQNFRSAENLKKDIKSSEPEQHLLCAACLEPFTYESLQTMNTKQAPKFRSSGSLNRCAESPASVRKLNDNSRQDSDRGVLNKTRKFGSHGNLNKIAGESSSEGKVRCRSCVACDAKASKDSNQLSRSIPIGGRPQYPKENPKYVADTRPDKHCPKRVSSAGSIESSKSPGSFIHRSGSDPLKETVDYVMGSFVKNCRHGLAGGKTVPASDDGIHRTRSSTLTSSMPVLQSPPTAGGIRRTGSLTHNATKGTGTRNSLDFSGQSGAIPVTSFVRKNIPGQSWIEVPVHSSRKLANAAGKSSPQQTRPPTTADWGKGNVYAVLSGKDTELGMTNDAESSDRREQSKSRGTSDGRSHVGKRTQVRAGSKDPLHPFQDTERQPENRSEKGKSASSPNVSRTGSVCKNIRNKK